MFDQYIEGAKNQPLENIMAVNLTFFIIIPALMIFSSDVTIKTKIILHTIHLFMVVVLMIYAKDIIDCIVLLDK